MREEEQWVAVILVVSLDLEASVSVSVSFGWEALRRVFS